MKPFFWFVMVLLVFGLLARIDIGGAGILGVDIVLPLFTGIWLFKKISLKEKFPNIPWISYGVIFLLWAFATFWFGAINLDTKPWLLSFAYVFRLFQFLLFGLAAADLFQTSKSIQYNDFFPPFFKIVFVIVLLGFIQFYVFPDISYYSTEGGWDPHVGRFLGTWLDPNYLAGFLSFVLPLALAYFCELFDANKKRKTFWMTFFILGIVYALFLTFSRSGYLAAVSGLVFFFLFRNPKILICTFLVIILGVSLNERAQKRVTELSGTFSAIILQQTDEIDPTASLRLQNWRKSFTLLQKYPLFGIGYNTYRYKAAEEGIVDENYFSAGGADSTHLTVLVTTGVIGFFLYIVWVWQIFWRLFQKFWRANKKKNHWIYLGACSGGISLFLHACFVNSLFFPLIFIPVMAVGGILSSEETSSEETS